MRRMYIVDSRKPVPTASRCIVCTIDAEQRKWAEKTNKAKKPLYWNGIND